MNRIPFIPESAPFTPEQRMWLNGFLAGVFSDANASGASALAGALGADGSQFVPKIPLIVLYGSQTGTAEGLAKKTEGRSGEARICAEAREHGKIRGGGPHEGGHGACHHQHVWGWRAADAAQGFWNWLSGASAPKLEHLRYSVLALGDTNYAGFCQFGKNCDERFAALGARRVADRKDCDVDYDAPAAEWTTSVFSALAGAEVRVVAGGTAADVGAGAVTEGYSRKNPFNARLITNRRLSAEGSAKDVRHFEISLAGSGLTYDVGDSLGVIPSNCPQLVGELLAALGCDGEEAVGDQSLRMALSQQFEITRPSADLLTPRSQRVHRGVNWRH